MHAKLQVDRRMAGFDDFVETFRKVVAGTSLMKKVNIMFYLFRRCDRGLRRKDFATMHGISPRTLNRWINKFNRWGLPGLLESSRKRPGRKRKVGRKDFDERILPEAEKLTEAAKEAVTAKALFRSAQKLGLFPWSYSTFRRRLGALPSKYRKPSVEPTHEEWIFFTRTGRWPRRLKSFGRRRENQENLAWQRMRESCQQSKAAAAQ